MSETESTAIGALETLLGERRKYERWLEQLEARRATTPDHVYARVHEDYFTRLTDVQVRLATEADGLQDEISSVGSALRTLETRLGELRDAHAEVELRASVGEYTAEEWEARRVQFESELRGFEEERDARRATLDRLEAMQGEALGAAAPAPTKHAAASVVEVVPPLELPTEGPSEAAADMAGETVSEAVVETASEVVAELVPEVVVDAPPAAAPERVPVPEPRPSAAVRAEIEATTIDNGPKFDDLAFLRQIVGRQTPLGIPAAPEEPVAATPEPSPVVPPMSRDSIELQPIAFDPRADLDVAPATQDPVAEPVARRSIEFSDDVPSPLAGVPMQGERQLAPDDPTARPSTDWAIPRESAGFGRPTPRTSQAIKTLKCGECGTLNYPTEWYCERCGGELAAL